MSITIFACKSGVAIAAAAAELVKSANGSKVAWSKPGKSERNSRMSATMRGWTAVAARRPPPAIRVLKVLKKLSSGLFEAWSSVTAIDYSLVSNVTQL